MSLSFYLHKTANDFIKTFENEYYLNSFAKKKDGYEKVCFINDYDFACYFLQQIWRR